MALYEPEFDTPNGTRDLREDSVKGNFAVLFGMVLVLGVSALALFLIVFPLVFLGVYLSSTEYETWAEYPVYAAGFFWLWFAFRFIFAFFSDFAWGFWRKIPYFTANKVWKRCKHHLRKTFLPFSKAKM